MISALADGPGCFACVIWKPKAWQQALLHSSQEVSGSYWFWQVSVLCGRDRFKRAHVFLKRLDSVFQRWYIFVDRLARSSVPLLYTHTHDMDWSNMPKMCSTSRMTNKPKCCNN